MKPSDRGLAVGDTGREIGFARTEASTVDTVAYLLGAAPDLHGPAPAGCPGRVARWRNEGLTLFFTDGDFDGWAWQRPASAGGTAQAGRVCAVP